MPTTDADTPYARPPHTLAGTLRPPRTPGASTLPFRRLALALTKRLPFLPGRFETAYCLIYENDECEEVFGKADLVTKDLIGLGREIVAKWGKK